MGLDLIEGCTREIHFSFLTTKYLDRVVSYFKRSKETVRLTIANYVAFLSEDSVELKLS